MQAILSRPALSREIGTATAGPTAGRRLWPWTLLVLLASLAFFTINLGRPTGEFDELYHMLAARGWLEHGEPRILDGAYERVRLYTVLVAQMFRLFGESFWAARLPSAVAMAGATALLFAWLYRAAGARAAWIATLLFATSPFVVELAQFARFYALQILAFLAATLALSAALAEPTPAEAKTWPRRLLWGALAAALYLAALYLQETTLMGLVGVGLWVLLGPGFAWWREQPSRTRGLVLAGLAALALLGLALLVLTPLGAELWQRYRGVPAWAAAAADQPLFYHVLLDLHYPTLWPVIPVLGLAALSLAWAPALLAAAIAGTALVLHSFAGFKGTPYLAYALPFLFALMGMGVAGLWPRLAGLVQGLTMALLPKGTAPRLARGLGTGMAALCLLFLLAANTAFPRTALTLAGIRVPPQVPLPQWAKARPLLEPWLEKAEIVVTTDELDAIRALGRHDLLISRSRLEDADPLPEFGVDRRTGRPVISTAASLETVMACTGSGLVITPEERWRKPAMLSDEVADLLTREAARVPLPAGLHLRAYAWERAPDAARPESCPMLPGRRAG